MRNYHSNRTHRSHRSDGSLWLSFSDLMSSLLLIIILILFYIMYQYFDMYEINMAEIARQQFDLDTANATLETERTKLSGAEQQLLAQQIRLNAAESDLESAEAILASQQQELAAAQTLLSQKESEITLQQTNLDTLTQQLGAQQVQIEQLVGMKPRIISSLSSALKDADISASVDPVSGAIALKSDVLFSTGQYSLTQEGCSRIDDFLPVYLDVLFSEEYLPYVSEIIIEGHTDSVGDYIRNLELSQQRAGAVASYVLSDSYSAITPTQRALLRKMATANGRSFSDPVLKPDGSEDFDSSRRVVFKFRLTDEQMIEQLKVILEDTPIEDSQPTPAPQASASPAPDAAE